MAIKQCEKELELQRESTMRLEWLVGSQAVESIRRSSVLLLGVGGVGSWCAEALIRSGVGKLHLLDADRVAPSNLNRQLMATHSTIGQLKVEALIERLCTINPAAELQGFAHFYNGSSGPDLSRYSMVIDCIDTLQSKVELAIEADKQQVPFVSSMGAARKLDPTQIAVASIWKTDGCPLAREMRRRLRLAQFKGDYPAVYSAEPPKGVEFLDETNRVGEATKRSFGSAVHITATFGMVLAGVALDKLGSFTKEE